MQTTAEKITYGFFILNIVVIFAALVYAINFVHNPITFNLNGRTISEDKPYNGDLTDLEILGTRFAMNHKYNESGYNCVNYTEDFLYIAKW
jgi:hypothetical protein